MNRSPTIAALATALAKAQGAMKGAEKDGANPHFKSKYSTLAAIWDACRDALSANELSIVQTPVMTEHGAGVETLLAHSSGEWISELLVLPVQKADAQGVGSAITYARRYALASFVGIAPEDDDGNAASKSVESARFIALKLLQVAAGKGTAALEAAWKSITVEQRQACKNDLAALKLTAAAMDAPVENQDADPVN